MVRIHRLISIFLLTFSFISSLAVSQNKEQTLQKIEGLLQKYNPPVMQAQQPTETPQQAWVKYYASSARSKTIQLRVNMMPSYYSSVTYANFILNEQDFVWGNATGGSTPYNYHIDFGDGNVDSGTTNDGHFIGIAHAYLNAGIKTATLLVVDNDGNRDSDVAVIKVFASPTKTIRVNNAIERGLIFLYKNQYPDGHWYDVSNYKASTGGALLCFEENGHKPNNDQTVDIYSEFVRKGLNWLFSGASTMSISVQTAGNPDTDGDGIGAFLDANTYANGISSLAVIGAHTLATEAKSDTIRVGALTGETYYDYAVDMVDQWAFSQSEGVPPSRGGWRYSVNTSTADQDNSTTQWATLDMEAAENSWGISVPSFVKSELLYTLQATQNANGGFGYNDNYGWVNITKTAAAIGSYAFLGYTADSPAVANGINFINSQWSATGGDQNNWAQPFSGNTYGMYGVAKGMRLINHRTGNQFIGTHDWYDEYVDHLLDDPTYRQYSDDISSYYFGYFPKSSYAPTAYMGDPLNSALGVLILTRGVVIQPPVAVVSSISSQPLGKSFDIDGSQSYHQNPDRSITEYLWDWDASNGVDFDNPDDFGPIPTNPGYNVPGTYTITLRVQDDSDPPLFSTTTITVVVDPANSNVNHAPIAVPIPRDRRPFYAIGIGVPLLLDARESYDPDEQDSIVSYSWDLDGNGEYGDATTDTVTRIFNSEFDGEIGLKVTDSRGAVSTNSSFLRVVAAPRNLSVVSFQVNPRVVYANDIVHLIAVFKNDSLSDNSVQNILVRFYDSDPLFSGSRLVRNDSRVDLPIGKLDTLDVTYQVPSTFKDTLHKIYVYLDANQRINEWDEVDNLKKVSLVVGHPGDTTYFRSLIPDSAVFSAKAKKLKKTTDVPNTGNIRDSVMARYGKNGLIIGIKQINASDIKKYGWIKFDKGGPAKFFPQSGDAQFFDSIRLFHKATKVFVKELKNPTFKKYSNHLAGELFTLEFNIASSSYGIFPFGFGDIVYDDGEPNNMYNEKTFQEVLDHADSVATLWSSFSGTETAKQIDTVISRINRAFYSPITEQNFTSKSPLILDGVRRVADVSYLLPPRKGTSQRFNAQFIPSQFELYQNYPNPFNPSTTLNFSLSDNAIIDLKVYNILGQEVATLINNESLESGDHSVVFDASHLSTGVYFARMIVNGHQHSSMRKMLLVK